MQRLGFIHDMMDVKVLILYVAARSHYPMTTQEIYELCYQDDCLSYFDICTALPEMVASGHLQQSGEDRYEITEKGRSDGQITEDSIAFTVKQAAENAVAKFNRQLRSRSFVKTQVDPEENGEYAVQMELNDERGRLMLIRLGAPNQRQALQLEKLLQKKAENIYSLTMAELLDDEDFLEE